MFMSNHKIWMMFISGLFFTLGGCTLPVVREPAVPQDVITEESIKDVVVTKEATSTIQPVIETTSPTAVNSSAE